MNKVLKRQLRKIYLDSEELPSSLEDWQKFLEVISKSYIQYDEDRYLLERSLEISSKEMEERIKINKDMTSQLIQANKLSSLGTLSAGIAHELNNPLAGLMGHIQLLIMREYSEEESKLKFEKCLKLLERMSSIVNHLRSLTREGKDNQFEIINIKKPLEDTFELLGKQLSYENISYEFKNDFEEIFINGDQNKLESIFNNLIINSFHAFKDHKEIEEKRISVNIIKKDNNVQLTFSDNAGGMSQEIQNQLFDPFFTTKDVGVGTGLGMSISKQIIKEHDGNITLESVEGEGTTFTIEFPIIEQEKKIKKTLKFKKKIKNTNQKPSSLKILVVDDEADLCEIYKYILKDHYQLNVYTDPLEAKKSLESEHYDLLITDMKMPSINGIEMAKIARSLNESIKLIFISGHTDDNETLTLFNEYKLISKPMPNIEVLLDAVDDFLKDKKIA